MEMYSRSKTITKLQKFHNLLPSLWTLYISSLFPTSSSSVLSSAGCVAPKEPHFDRRPMLLLIGLKEARFPSASEVLLRDPKVE